MMSDTFLEKVSYRINEVDVIVDIFDDWVNAAIVGQAMQLSESENVIGRNIFSYLHDDTTRMYYRAVFMKCRILRKKHELDYRCDSPTHKRFMKMELMPDANNDIIFLNYLLKEEPFAYSVNIIDNNNAFNTSFTKRCSICNNLRLKGSKDWVSPESISQEKEQTFSVIHTVCPNCQNKDWRV